MSDDDSEKKSLKERNLVTEFKEAKELKKQKDEQNRRISEQEAGAYIMLIIAELNILPSVQQGLEGNDTLQEDKHPDSLSVYKPEVSKLHQGSKTYNPEDAFAIFTKNIIKSEGCRNDVYLDSEGKLTVGIGHLVEGDESYVFGQVLSDQEVKRLFAEDARWAFNAAIEQTQELGITDPESIAAYAEVNFQLGPNWRDKFPQTWATMQEGRFGDAADMLNGTRWQGQTPNRVKNFQMALNNLEGQPRLEFSSNFKDGSSNNTFEAQLDTDYKPVV